jgi:hypothetical protein
MVKSDQDDIPFYLSIAFLSLVAPLVLLSFRYLDDNRLTSWRWIFADQKPTSLFLLLCGAVGVAFVFSRFPFNRRRLLFLVLASFLAAAMFWPEPEVIVDTARYFTQAKQLAFRGVGYFFSEWGREIFAWTDLPLVPFCYGLVFKVFGENRIYIQLCTTACFTGAVLLTYSLGKLLWDEETGFHGALLLLAFPYLYSQVPLMLVDVPTMFFFLLAVYLFTRALRRGGVGNTLLAALAIFLAMYTKFSVWVFFAGFGIIFLTHALSSPLPAIRRCGAIIIIAGVLIGTIFYLKQQVLLEQIRFLVEYQKPGLGRWGEGYISTFFFHIHLLVTAAAIYSVVAAVWKKDYAYLNIAGFVCLIFILQLQRIRYTLPLFPFIALLASYGLREISSQRARRFFVFSAVFSSLLIALTAALPFLMKMSAENIKEAGLFLNTLNIDEAEVLVERQEDDVVNPELAVPLLDYFSTVRITYAGNMSRPDINRYRNSPLRFTWEYHPPLLYRPESAPPLTNGKAVVIVSSRPAQTLPGLMSEKISHFPHRRIFAASTGIFLHQTRLSVYFN